ncbi:MAG TPA: histidine--tRNA ligase [Candidatus Binataceae bacterium]|nr:histidine--tRNA ligase [Candidatus Binataceae bacterium]
MHLTRLRGFQDLIGPSARAVSRVEDCARAIMERHAVHEMRIPILERLELYQRSSGETSDVVEKQMYAFSDADEAETLLAIRPEGTPGVVRAYIEAGLDRSDPEQRFYYSGPMFRRERPQKGRFRQFHQFGVEIFGRADAACDAELLIMIDELRQELKLELEFQINSLGHAECRPAYRAALLEYGRAHLTELCADCHQRLERNPLRLLDCKIDVKLAAGAPKSIDYLCDACRAHFATVERLLSGAGVPYVVNPRLVRGLDYYMRTTFEVVSTAVGSQSAVVAGGRYDGLVEALGGAPVAGTGFAIGVERLALALEATGGAGAVAPDVALIALGDSAVVAAMKLAGELWRRGICVELLAPDRGLKALMRRANKLGAHFAIIVGENELARGVVQLRDLRAGTQRELPQAVVAGEIAAVSEPAR